MNYKTDFIRINEEITKLDINKQKYPNQQKILFYLKRGRNFLYTPHKIYDPITGEVIARDCSSMTDEKYSWTDRLIYLIQTYNYRLPQDIEEYILDKVNNIILSVQSKKGNYIMIELAYEIAKKYHYGQVDKSGRDYINHPVSVASKLKNEDEKIVALLHDTLEDTNLTKNDLESYGFDSNVIEAVVTVTKLENEDYFEFINRVKQNPLARKVKIADLLHNLDLNRLTKIKSEDLERHQKYLKALEILIFD